MCGRKKKLNRITVLICSNTDGLVKWDLLVIGNAEKPLGLAKVLSMPVMYISNTKAWMTRHIFSKWLANFDKEMVKAMRKVLLLWRCCFRPLTQPPSYN